MLAKYRAVKRRRNKVGFDDNIFSVSEESKRNNNAIKRRTDQDTDSLSSQSSSKSNELNVTGIQELEESPR